MKKLRYYNYISLNTNIKIVLIGKKIVQINDKN